MRRNTTVRVFACPACNEKITAYKTSSRMTSKNHVKHMWCWKCQDVQAFVQLAKEFC